MLTDRCSFELSKILKEHNFPQRSFEFFSDYYTENRDLIFNKEDAGPDLIFAPLICEVLDRFDIDLNINLSVYYNINCKIQYRIFDLTEGVKICKTLENEDILSRAYELCILEAIKYYDSKVKEEVKKFEDG